MDEPCSALDPISTLAIEDLIDDVIDALTRSDDRRWPWQHWIGPSS